MEIWLDLEQTIISTWEDPVACNIEKVSAFLEELNPQFVNIFSFAVWNSRDQRIFHERLKPWLSNLLGVQINSCPCLDDIRREAFSGTVLDNTEMTSMFGKAGVFDRFIRATRGSGVFILVDDVVDDSVTVRRLPNGCTQRIHLVNVDNI
jgi:hypothetical protein